MCCWIMFFKKHKTSPFNVLAILYDIQFVLKMNEAVQGIWSQLVKSWNIYEFSWDSKYIVINLSI